MNKNKITLKLIPLLFIAAGIVYVEIGMKKEREERNLLKEESGFSIGVFESLKYTNGRASGIDFNYTIDGKSYEKYDPYYYMDSPKATVDIYNLRTRIDKFMVMYDKDNPHESIIRLDYPIKDSADFKRYINEFEQMRKQKTKE